MPEAHLADTETYLKSILKRYRLGYQNRPYQKWLSHFIRGVWKYNMLCTGLFFATCIYFNCLMQVVLESWIVEGMVNENSALDVARVQALQSSFFLEEFSGAEQERRLLLYKELLQAHFTSYVKKSQMFDIGFAACERIFGFLGLPLPGSEQTPPWYFHPDTVLALLYGISFLFVVGHRLRWHILRRHFLIMGVVFAFRGISIIATPLYVPYPHCELAGSLNENLLLEGLKASLSLRVTCCDCLFSGHTMNFVLVLFEWANYNSSLVDGVVVDNPWQRRVNRCIYILGFVGLILIILTKFHYTVDVWLGGIITFFVCQSHGFSLRSREFKYSDENWWRLLRFTEFNSAAALQKPSHWRASLDSNVGRKESEKSEARTSRESIASLSDVEAYSFVAHLDDKYGFFADPDCVSGKWLHWIERFALDSEELESSGFEVQQNESEVYDTKIDPSSGQGADLKSGSVRRRKETIERLTHLTQTE